METLRDSSEIKEAAALFGELFSDRRAAAITPQRSREQRLAQALRMMAERSGISYAAVVDERGLPLAAHGDALTDSAVGAFVTLASDCLGKIAGIVESWDIRHVAYDIGYTDKAVVRAFTVGDKPFYLIIICGQDTDERSEVELSIEAISAIVCG